MDTYYDRLSALDAAFLGFEQQNAHWHGALVLVFDAGPLRTADGRLDFDKIVNNYEWSFERVPRYRQRLARTPWLDHPVWIDDPNFDIHYHVRHIALPQPGDDQTFKRVCGYLVALAIDMEKPPWEVWVVDGLENDRFALVTKIHHCMADGIGAVGMIQALVGPQPFERQGAPKPWSPRPAPGGATLVKAEVARRMRAPFDLAKPLRQPREALRAARDVVEGIVEASKLGWRPASNTVFNPRQIGPHRRFDWTEVSLREIKEAGAPLGGTINDVVLTTAAGAFGKFLREHRTKTTEIDFRALIPVSVRKHKETKLGNHVAMVMAELPLSERNPIARLQRVIETTQRLKDSKQWLGVSWLEDVADRIGGRFFVELSLSATRNRPFNVVVTNVPGPQVPLYFLGARMRAVYPMMPLFPNQALAVAVLSYNGKMYWGFNSDRDELPDVHQLVEDVSAEFRELHTAAQRSGPSAEAEIALSR